MTTRYWIYDKDDSKTRFPLGALLNLAISFFNSNILNIAVHRAEGYGEKISSWDELLINPADQLAVSFEQVQELLNCDEEIIYWLDVEFNLDSGECFRFGLHDSSSMYLETAADLRDLLAKEYAKLEISPGNK